MTGLEHEQRPEVGHGHDDGDRGVRRPVPAVRDTTHTPVGAGFYALEPDLSLAADRLTRPLDAYTARIGPREAAEFGVLAMPLIAWQR